ALHLPAVVESERDLLPPHPARPPHTRLAVAEAHHVVAATWLDNRGQARDVPGPGSVVEDVEQPAVDDGVEAFAQALQVQRVSDLEPGRQAPFRGLAARFLDGQR